MDLPSDTSPATNSSASYVEAVLGRRLGHLQLGTSHSDGSRDSDSRSMEGSGAEDDEEAARRRMELEALMSTSREEPLGSSDEDYVDEDYVDDVEPPGAWEAEGAARAAPPRVAGRVPPPRGGVPLPTAQPGTPHTARPCGLPAGAVPAEGPPGTHLHFVFARPCDDCGSTRLWEGFPVYSHRDVLVSELGQLVPVETSEACPPPARHTPPQQSATMGRPMMPAQQQQQQQQQQTTSGQQIQIQVSPTATTLHARHPTGLEVSITSTRSWPDSVLHLRPRFHQPLPWEPVLGRPVMRPTCPTGLNCACSTLLAPGVMLPRQLLQQPPLLGQQQHQVTPIRGQQPMSTMARQQQQQQQQHHMGASLEQSEFLATALMVPQLTLVQSQSMQQQQPTAGGHTMTTVLPRATTNNFSTGPQGVAAAAAAAAAVAADGSNSVPQTTRSVISGRGCCRRHQRR